MLLYVFTGSVHKAKEYPIGDFTRSASAKRRKKFVGTNHTLMIKTEEFICKTEQEMCKLNSG